MLHSVSRVASPSVVWARPVSVLKISIQRWKGDGDVFPFRAAPVEVSEAPDVLRVNFVPKPGGAGVLEPEGVLALKHAKNITQRENRIRRAIASI